MFLPTRVDRGRWCLVQRVPSITPGGVFTWTPTEAQGPGSYAVTMRVTDDGTPNLSGDESFTVTVNEANAAPVLASIGDKSIDEQTSLSFVASATDSDNPANLLTYSLIGAPAGASINPITGLFDWTPTETQGPGSYAVTIRVTDNGTPNLFDEETITITVSETNAAPSIVDPGSQVSVENDAVSLAMSASDPDIPANGLTFTATGLPPGIAIDPATGVITGTISFDAGLGSPYSVTVTVLDDGVPALSAGTTFSWVVTKVNRPPDLAPLADRTDAEDAAVTILVFGTDPDSADTLEYSATGLPPGMSIDPLSGTISGSLSFDAAASSPYSVTVTVADDGSPNLSDSEGLVWTVTNVNRPPTADPQSLSTLATPISILLTGSDPDSEPLTFTVVGGPASGTLSGIAPNLIYTPLSGFSGIDSFTFEVNDGDLTATADVTIEVVLVNGPPSAFGETYSVVEGETLEIAAPGVLGNDTDPDGNPLTAVVLSGPSHGSLTLNESGGFVYVHTGSDHTDDSFTYRAFDGFAYSTPATVTITIIKANDPPIAMDDFVSTVEDVAFMPDLLANDSDPDGDPIEITTITPPTFGVAALTPSGAVQYTPPLNWYGTARFGYSISDGKGGVDTANVTVAVGARNDDPVAEPDSVLLNKYGPTSVFVLSNDSDIDGDLLRVLSADYVGLSHVTVNQDGTITYEPYIGLVGVETFRYVLEDGNGGEDTGTVRVEVTAEALELADDAAEAIGSDLLGFETPDSSQFAMGEVSLSPAAGVNLLTDAFFQSLDILRLPLALLGAAVVWSLTLGGFFNLGGIGGLLALLFPAKRRRSWSVVLLSAEDAVTVHKEPDVSTDVVHNFGPVVRGIESTGRSKVIDGIAWLPVETPQGEGWANADYLTEQIDAETFAADGRAAELAERFVARLESGEGISGLLGRRGLFVSHSVAPIELGKGELDAIASGGEAMTWRVGDGIYKPVTGTFRSAVAEPLVGTYRAPGNESLVDRPVLASALIPTHFRNFHYISIGSAGSLNSWMIYFEYHKNKPHIVGVSVDG